MDRRSEGRAGRSEGAKRSKVSRLESLGAQRLEECAGSFCFSAQGTDNSVHPFPWQSLTCTHHTLYRAGIGGTEINELVLVLNKLCDEFILRWREGITLPARSPGQRSLREGFWKAVECEMSDTHPSGALLDWSCHSCPLKCVVQQGGGRERGSVGLDPVPGGRG